MWKHDVERLSPEALRLLRAARLGGEPSADAYARLLAAIANVSDVTQGPTDQPRSDGGLGTISAKNTLKGGRATGALASFAGSKLGALISGAVGGLVVGIVGTRTFDTPATTNRAVPLPHAEATAQMSGRDGELPSPLPSVSISTPASSEAQSPPGRAMPSAPDGVPSSTLVDQFEKDRRLAAERAQIDTARSALSRGNSAAAMEALKDHLSAYPRGRLVEEREGLWVHALVSAGRRDEARDRLKQFEKTFPRSMMLPLLREAAGDNQ